MTNLVLFARAMLIMAFAFSSPWEFSYSLFVGKVGEGRTVMSEHSPDGRHQLVIKRTNNLLGVIPVGIGQGSDNITGYVYLLGPDNMLIRKSYRRHLPETINAAWNRDEVTFMLPNGAETWVFGD
ncbi:MAG: hypothetical protein K1X53_09445 [Candidatus Sumerlaeaceae bacterium]|nr:hypothetical protein [Candidatus Sumerlaeaceae bacterium]